MENLHSKLPLPDKVGLALEAKAKKLGIKYFLPSLCSMSMGVRAPLIPVSAIKDIACKGFNFHGFGDFGTGLEEPELYVVPDPSSLIQLPWKPEYGWMACNLYMKGKISQLCPRYALMRQIENLKKAGYVLKTGFEPEFFILDKNELKENTVLEKPGNRFHDPLLVMENSNILRKILDILDELGWKPYQIEKEGGMAQYEVCYDFADALTSADRMVFIKFMIKEIAREAGMRASFMPFLPKFSFGCGQHIHMSLWDVIVDVNAMPGNGELGFSGTGRHWLAGVLDHLDGLTAIACPTVNSYKRLHAYKNFANFHGYGVNSRYVPLRIVEVNDTCDRIEYRTPDGSVNPYLIQAAIIATGLDGLEKAEDPNPKLRNEEALFDESSPKDSKVLPQTLDFAIQALETDETLMAALGEPLIIGFHTVKEIEMDPYRKEVSEVEKNAVEMY